MILPNPSLLRKLLVFSTVGIFLAQGPLVRPALADEKPVVPGAPHLLPQDALAYIRLDSADDLRVDLADSSIGRMLADPKLKPFASDVYRTAADLFLELGAQMGVSLDELLAIPSGQVALAAMPGNISDQEQDNIREQDEDDSPEAIRRRIALKRRQQNAIAGLFMIDAGDNVDDLLELVHQLEDRVLESGYVRRTTEIEKTTLVRLLPPRQGRPEIEYFERDDTVVLGIGHETASKALDQWLDRSDEPTLADRTDFASVMARCVGAEDTRPQLTFFLDPYHLVERVVKRGGAAALVWPLIEELGIGKIRGIGGSAFRGGEVFDDISHLHVLIDPPRDGFFGVLRPQTGDSLPPNWVPSDVTSYTSIHWDFETTYDNFGKVLEKFQGPEPLKRFVEDPIQKAVGVSVRDDVAAKLTGRYVTCRWIQPPIKLNSQVQLHAFEVSDALAAKEVIAKVRERRPNDLEVETIGGTVVYFGRQGRNRNLPKNLRRPEPCFMVLGNWVILSDSRKFLERVTSASREALPRLVNVPEYELVSSELGGKLDGEKPFLVSFLRSADYIGQMYELVKSKETRGFVRQRGQDNPVLGKISAMLDRNELPPFEDFKKYFAPSGTFAYDEPTGMHLGSFTLKADE
jgi:hypothetical protein